MIVSNQGLVTPFSLTDFMGNQKKYKSPKQLNRNNLTEQKIRKEI